ncbi:hypothetical protein D3C84_1026100 [compost metagenome]
MPTSSRSLLTSPGSVRQMPSIRMSPSLMVSSWLRVRRKVDLPEPLGPTITTTSPSATWVLTFFRACTPPA